MKTIVKIYGVFPQQNGLDIYQEILKVYPQAIDNGSIYIRLPEDDPQLQKVLQCLSLYDYKPWDHKSEPQPFEFNMELQRIYDKQDYESASYLKPKPRLSFGSPAGRTPEGILRMRSDRKIDVKEDVGIGAGSWLIISDRVKPLFEQAHLQYVDIRPVEFFGYEIERLQGRFWEVTSDLRLPPLSSACKLLDSRDGRLVDADYEGAYVLREGLDIPELLNITTVEYHYTASAMKSAGSFDLARTYEHFGPEGGLVASNRFYQFCTDLHLKMDWVPVRIDSD